MHDIARTHDHHAGLFHERDAPLGRDYSARSFTVGIGGPVGSGKTALLLAFCRAPERSIAARRRGPMVEYGRSFPITNRR